MKKMIIAICLSVLFSINIHAEFPVQGIHFQSPGPRDVDICVEFIKNDLSKYDLNAMILEINTNYQYTSQPKLASGLSKEDVLAIANACKENGIEFIPMINCFGHQSWAKQNGKLLTEFPEFDETPNKYPDNEDIYCRSYCPYHPDVHNVIFSMMDELCELTGAKTFHVGLDEVFIIADEDCPRCKGKSTAEVFAYEVNTLHRHLKAKGIEMWMWGDRFIDGYETGIGEWEASTNGTAPSIDMVPNDIVICDWHYEKPHPTMIHFALKGFDVMPSPWRKPEVAKGQLDLIRMAKASSSKAVAERFRGVLHTTWCGMAPFVRAYHGEERENNKAAYETVECFKALYDAMN